MPESSSQRRGVAQAVEIMAALPTVGRASERRESPIRARSHRVDNRQPRNRRRLPPPNDFCQLCEDALNRLIEPANSQINWAFGNLLRARATRADWLKCRLLQQLETGANLDAWDELCRRRHERVLRMRSIYNTRRKVCSLQIVHNSMST